MVALLKIPSICLKNPKDIKIFIKTLTGKTITIFINLKETIKILKQKIQKKEGLKPEQQILIFAEKELEDNKILYE